MPRPRSKAEPSLEQAFSMLQQLASSGGKSVAASDVAPDAAPAGDEARAAVRLPELPSGTLLIDADGRILHLDSGAERVFRCNVAEMIGARAGIFVAGPLPAGPGPSDVVCRRRDGSTFAAELAQSKVRIEGRLVRVLTVRDKEAFLRLAVEHHESELRFRHLVEQIPAVTFTAALQGRGLGEIYVSPQIEILLGYSQAQWISNPVLWYERLHSDDRGKLDAEFARGCMTGGPFRAECRFIARDGSVVWVHGEARIIRDAAGRPLFLQGVAFNITDIRHLHEEQAARAAAEREHRKEKLLSEASLALAHDFGDDVALQAVADLLAPVHCDWCLIDAVDERDTWRVAAVGCAPHARASAGEAIRTREPRWDVSQHRPDWAELVRIEMVTEGNLADAAPESARIFAAMGAGSLASFPLHSRGRLLGVLTLASERGSRRLRRDDVRFGAQLAERIAIQLENARLYREAREAIQVRDEVVEDLERAVHFSEMFVGILGHDLRNPLASIVTAATLLQRRASGEALQRPIGRILRSGERMRRMIDQILDFTSVRLGRGLPLHRRDTDLVEVCRTVVDELVDEGRPKTVQLTLHGKASGRWDADRLGQLLSNLIGNALQHRAGERPVEVSVDGTDPHDVTVEVWNEGAVPEALMPVLFDPLRSSGRARQNGSSGLGLGLFISREIATAHGGAIELFSSPSEGTRFKVRLPRRRSTRRSPRGTPRNVDR